MKYKAEYSVKRTGSDGDGYFRVIGKDREGTWEMVTFTHDTEVKSAPEGCTKRWMF